MSGTSTWVLLLGGVLLVGVGFAAGYVVRSDVPAAVSGPSGVERDLEREQRAPSLRREEGVAPARLESTLASELEPLRRAVEALPSPPIPTGTGIIIGTILTEAGEPLAGVEVQATPSQVPESIRGKAKSQEGLDLPTKLRRYADRLRWQEGTRRSTVTGGDGSYRLEGLIESKHNVRAEKEGWTFRSNDQAYGTELGATLDFTAKERIVVHAQIYLPDGTMPDTARVRFKAGRRTQTTSWRPEHPELRVDPGTYRAIATAGASSEYASEPVSVTVVRGEQAPRVRFDLEGRPVLKGTVAFEDDHGGSRTAVRVARLPKDRPADPALLGPDSRTARISSRRGGVPTFQFEDLKSGRYLVGVARDWQGPVVATKVVDLGEGLTEVELEVPLPPRDAYVILRITGPDGSPLSDDLQISTGYRSKTGSSAGGGVVITRPGGERWILHHRSSIGADEEGTYTIKVTHPLYGAQEAAYEAGSAPTLDMRFDEPATLEIQISGLVGTDYEGRVQVQVRTERNQPVQLGRSDGVPDDEGRIQFEGLQPGTYELQLHMKSVRWGGGAVAAQSVVVKRGSNQARIAMPPLYSITIEGVTGQGFIQRKGEHGWHRMVAGARDGRAVVDGLPAGDYSAHVGQKKAAFRLPGPTTVRLD